MTKRSEKPSPAESSTDTIIAALNKIRENDHDYNEHVVNLVLIEASLRLDKLEREIEQLRNVGQSLKYEHVAWAHDVQNTDGDIDVALSFSESGFPFMGVSGYRSIACSPLYKLCSNN